MRIIVTGGAGFIGSACIRALIRETEHSVLNVDCLTYASDLRALEEVSGNPRYSLSVTDIRSAESVRNIVNDWKPDAILHLAAESHVDRSISGPETFIQTNVMGTLNLLEAVRNSGRNILFHHVSTDEVFGSLVSEGFFSEETRYDPSSPYSASKAASDHLVRSWGRTFGIRHVITNCSNNFGPWQNKEKLIPSVVSKIRSGQKIPVYGNGLNVRDWLFVEDHVRALILVLTQGISGESYNIGGSCERTNLDIVHGICEIMEELWHHHKFPRSPEPFTNLISFVSDRPGHDFRYAIDASKIREQLKWSPSSSFQDNLRKTVAWYLEQEA